MPQNVVESINKILKNAEDNNLQVLVSSEPELNFELNLEWNLVESLLFNVLQHISGHLGQERTVKVKISESFLSNTPSEATSEKQNQTSIRFDFFYPSEHSLLEIEEDSKFIELA